MIKRLSGLRTKKDEEQYKKELYASKHEYPKCYKYCVDTHKYVVIGNVIDEEIFFNEAYPLRDNAIPRAYQYVFFIQIDGNFKTFTPKNVPQQVSVNQETNYVVGYMKDKDEVVYYDQCSYE